MFSCAHPRSERRSAEKAEPEVGRAEATRGDSHASGRWCIQEGLHRAREGGSRGAAFRPAAAKVVTGVLQGPVLPGCVRAHLKLDHRDDAPSSWSVGSSVRGSSHADEMSRVTSSSQRRHSSVGDNRQRVERLRRNADTFLQNEWRNMSADMKAAGRKTFRLVDPQGNAIPGEFIRDATLGSATQTLLEHWGGEAPEGTKSARAENQRGWRSTQEDHELQATGGDGESSAAASTDGPGMLSDIFASSEVPSSPSAAGGTKTAGAPGGDANPIHRSSAYEGDSTVSVANSFEPPWMLEPLDDGTLGPTQGERLGQMPPLRAHTTLEALKVRLHDRKGKKKMPVTRSATRRAAEEHNAATEANESGTEAQDTAAETEDAPLKAAEHELDRALRIEEDAFIASILSGEVSFGKLPSTGWSA